MGEAIMNSRIFTSIFVLGFLFAGYAQAGDAVVGKAKSAACTGCHGLNGKSNNPMYPNLASQNKLYLIKAMKDYRDGKRKDPMMNSMLITLTDSDFENIATYYSSLK